MKSAFLFPVAFVSLLTWPHLPTLSDRVAVSELSEAEVRRALIELCERPPNGDVALYVNGALPILRAGKGIQFLTPADRGAVLGLWVVSLKHRRFHFHRRGGRGRLGVSGEFRPVAGKWKAVVTYVEEVISGR
jgi:hypothetical protein